VVGVFPRVGDVRALVCAVELKGMCNRAHRTWSEFW
jgi:hypothetical protein